MKRALMILGSMIGALILVLLGHLVVWSLIPPLSPHALAKQGGFVSVDGVDTYYERYGSGPPIILIPPGGAHTSTWRYNIAALSRRMRSGRLTCQAPATPPSPLHSPIRTAALRGSSETS